MNIASLLAGNIPAHCIDAMAIAMHRDFAVFSLHHINGAVYLNMYFAASGWHGGFAKIKMLTIDIPFSIGSLLDFIAAERVCVAFAGNGDRTMMNNSGCYITIVVGYTINCIDTLDYLSLKSLLADKITNRHSINFYIINFHINFLFLRLIAVLHMEVLSYIRHIGSNPDNNGHSLRDMISGI